MNEILHAFNDMPRRVRTALHNPIRRRHLIVEFGSRYVVAYLWTRSWPRALGVTLTCFVLYEFCLEPLTVFLMRKARETALRVAVLQRGSALDRFVIWLGRWSWVRAYFEGGPRDGETYGDDA